MEFRAQVEQLIENLEATGGHEDECDQLRQINLVVYRTGIVDDSYTEIYEQIKSGVKLQQKQYIYNKTGQLTRSRQKRQVVQQYCQNCQVKLDNFFQCQECGTKVIYEQKIGQKPQDKIEKFQQFMVYFQGISSIPYFVCNYMNKVLSEEEIESDQNHIKIKFPFTGQVMNKKRSDIQRNNFQMDVYPEKEMCIPVWSFKDFKNVMKSYREKSKEWQNSSYLPRDAIYLPTLYIGLYELHFPLFSEEDKHEMTEIYKKILVQQTERKNEFTIFHVLTGLITYIQKFKKYSDYLYLVKSKDINQELKRILCNE